MMKWCGVKTANWPAETNVRFITGCQSKSLTDTTNSSIISELWNIGRGTKMKKKNNSKQIFYIERKLNFDSSHYMCACAWRCWVLISWPLIEMNLSETDKKKTWDVKCFSCSSSRGQMRFIDPKMSILINVHTQIA